MTPKVESAVTQGRGERLLIGIGLLTVVVGMAGAVVESIGIQMVLYGLTEFGWVAATATLVMRHSQRRERVVAAGFLLLTIAEMLLWANGRPVDPGYETGFAGGAMFYVPGLLMIGIPAVYPIVVRLLAVASAGAWVIGLALYLTGSEFSSTHPVATVGYGLLVVVYVGVAVVVLRNRRHAEAPTGATLDDGRVMAR